jgi:hypothetical protein
LEVNMPGTLPIPPDPGVPHIQARLDLVDELLDAGHIIRRGVQRCEKYGVLMVTDARRLLQFAALLDRCAGHVKRSEDMLPLPLDAPRSP